MSRPSSVRRSVASLTTAVVVAAVLAALPSSPARADAPDVRTAIGDGDCKAAAAAINRGMERNDAEAYYFAGYLYDATGCVADDPAHAARLYRRAADLGSAEGAAALAMLYGLGRGVDRDYAEAHRWFAVAAKQTGAEPPASAAPPAVSGYAMTVVGLAAAKVRYPRQMEKDGVAATFDAVFVPATGAVTFRDIKAGIAIGSNVSRRYVFTDEVAQAYAAAVGTLPRPDGVGATLAFVTPWRFAMLRSVEDRPTTQGGVTIGTTTIEAP